MYFESGDSVLARWEKSIRGQVYNSSTAFSIVKGQKRLSSALLGVKETPCFLVSLAFSSRLTKVMGMK